MLHDLPYKSNEMLFFLLIAIYDEAMKDFFINKLNRLTSLRCSTSTRLTTRTRKGKGSQKSESVTAIQWNQQSINKNHNHSSDPCLQQFIVDLISPMQDVKWFLKNVQNTKY